MDGFELAYDDMLEAAGRGWIWTAWIEPGPVPRIHAWQWQLSPAGMASYLNGDPQRRALLSLCLIDRGRK